jgi:hypothetical protein
LSAENSTFQGEIVNKYPLDDKGIQNIILDIVQNDKYQKELVLNLCHMLRNAMAYVEDTSQDWYGDAQKTLNEVQERRLAFENLRFDQANGHKTEVTSPYENAVKTTTEAIPESEFGDVWTDEELAAHFNEPLPKKQGKAVEKSTDKMTLEEIEEWEKKQDNSNDIYKLSARIKNLARREANNNLTNVGDMLANTYTHVLKSLYDFADTISDKETKIKLTDLLRSKESMPADFIAAVNANVKLKKK